MIKLIEAQNFRSLKSISCAVAPFNVLVGSNGSGKTTFLDVLQFISDLLREKTIAKVLEKRNIYQYEHITFACQGGDVQFAIEAEIPNNLREKLWNEEADTIRYELRFGLGNEGLSIKEERVLIFIGDKNTKTIPLDLNFPNDYTNKNIVGSKIKKEKGFYRLVLSQSTQGRGNFYDETVADDGKGWEQRIYLGGLQSAFSFLMPDNKRYPVSRWFYKFLTENMQTFVLESLELRKASPPRYRDSFSLDGSNLPWNVKNLKEKNPKKFQSWVEHVQTAIQGLKSIDAILREDDRHCYLKLTFEGGAEIPSWLVSDGTLRLMAFTILAYLPDLEKTFLIEEPENGIHPKNMETIFQSLSHVKNSQVFLATHSPVILSLLVPEQILCFAKTEGGITDIVRGDMHPQLMDWKGEIDLSILHAGGVLG